MAMTMTLVATADYQLVRWLVFRLISSTGTGLLWEENTVGSEQAVYDFISAAAACTRGSADHDLKILFLHAPREERRAVPQPCSTVVTSDVLAASRAHTCIPNPKSTITCYVIVRILSGLSRVVIIIREIVQDAREVSSKPPATLEGFHSFSVAWW